MLSNNTGTFKEIRSLINAKSPLAREDITIKPILGVGRDNQLHIWVINDRLVTAKSGKALMKIETLEIGNKDWNNCVAQWGNEIYIGGLDRNLIIMRSHWN